jgi:hypothetical protein
MPSSSLVFWLPRRGNSPTEYEDACAADDATGRYAVADGASEGCFTDLWARLLVEDFVHRLNCLAAEWPASLTKPQGQWDADVHRETLPWHAERGVQEGAHAAFLGISLAGALSPLGKEQGAIDSPLPPGERQRKIDSPLPPGEGQGVRAFHWQAVAVGDSCLFHTRDSALLRAFPLERSEQFDNIPKLVGARMSLEQIQRKRRVWADGDGRAGDRLWAMTDALAQWCLAEVEAAANPWAELESLLAESESGRFASWIESLRQSGRLRNDDVTLLAIPL